MEQRHPPPSFISFYNKINNNKAMKQFAVVLLLALAFTQQAEAQTFLNELRENKQGQGTVTVTQSKEIDELVNNAKLVRNQTATAHKGNDNKPSVTERSTTTRNETTNKTTTETVPVNRNVNTRTEPETDAPAVDTSKKVMRGGRKITGYRVQAFSGGNSRADRQKAENIGNAIKMRFPDLPIYVHFYSPRWICRVGNFRTYQEANEILKEIKDMGYRQACIVKGKITVRY